VEEAGAAQVSGDLHKAQRSGTKVLLVLPSQTMAGENETSLQRKEPRRTPNTQVCSDLRPRSAKNSSSSLTGELGRESFGSEEAGLLDLWRGDRAEISREDCSYQARADWRKKVSHSIGEAEEREGGGDQVSRAGLFNTGLRALR